MNKLFVKRETLLWVLILAPFVFSMYYWNSFPERVPVHWGIDGKPNGYGSRFEGAFLLPIVNLGMYFLLLFIPRIDPKKENFAQFQVPYLVFRYVLHAFLLVVFTMTTLSGVLHFDINVSYIMHFGVPALFLVLGNFMGKIRPNYMVGVRTPWTLANEDVWVKTHRFTGKAWVVASLVAIVLVLLNALPNWCFLVYILVLTLLPIVYSYILFVRISKEGR